MAQFNGLGWGITIGDVVKEYKRRKEEVFGSNAAFSYIDLMDEYSKSRFGILSDLDERWLNTIMAEAVQDMQTARDLFKKHDADMRKMFGPDYVSYPRDQQVI